MPASVFFLAASAATRAASLNLCTDEYLLLLARPDEIASVSYLSQDPLESSLWRRAKAYKANRGSVEDVLTSRPSLLFSMGGGGRATELIASRLHMRSVNLPYATSLAGVERNLRAAAEALGDFHRADPWIQRMEQLRRDMPRVATDAIWVSGRGDSLASGSLGAQWLRLAGFQQRALPGGRATLETLLTAPPKVLITSDYRSTQVSEGASWLRNPVVRRARAKQLVTDGRPWTCMGPLMIDEVIRLRRAMK